MKPLLTLSLLLLGVLAPGQVARPFDPPAERWLPGHRGVDLVAHLDQEVVSPAPGRVIYAGPLVDRSVISVELASGLRLTFEPVTPIVQVGDAVERGQVLGRMATSGSLHWGAKYPGDQYVDPLALTLGPIRLKSWP
ncbi:M23 family metallopeptidase [Actinomyces sp. F1_1611]